MKERPSIPLSPGEGRDPNIVSGEIETGDTPIDAEAALLRLQGDFVRDFQLAADWEAAAGETDPTARISALLDRLNAHRRELNASDTDQGTKQARDRMLSDLSNRLRELL